MNVPTQLGNFRCQLANTKLSIEKKSKNNLELKKEKIVDLKSSELDELKHTNEIAMDRHGWFKIERSKILAQNQQLINIKKGISSKEEIKIRIRENIVSIRDCFKSVNQIVKFLKVTQDSFRISKGLFSNLREVHEGNKSYFTLVDPSELPQTKEILYSQPREQTLGSEWEGDYVSPRMCMKSEENISRLDEGKLLFDFDYFKRDKLKFENNIITMIKIRKEIIHTYESLCNYYHHLSDYKLTKTQKLMNLDNKLSELKKNLFLFEEKEEKDTKALKSSFLKKLKSKSNADQQKFKSLKESNRRNAFLIKMYLFVLNYVKKLASFINSISELAPELSSEKLKSFIQNMVLSIEENLAGTTFSIFRKEINILEQEDQEDEILPPKDEEKKEYFKLYSKIFSEKASNRDQMIWKWSLTNNEFLKVFFDYGALESELLKYKNYPPGNLEYFIVHLFEIAFEKFDSSFSIIFQQINALFQRFAQEILKREDLRGKISERSEVSGISRFITPDNVFQNRRNAINQYRGFKRGSDINLSHSRLRNLNKPDYLNEKMASPITPFFERE